MFKTGIKFPKKVFLMLEVMLSNSGTLIPPGSVVGQEEWIIPGSYSFEVPAGVYSICAVGVSGSMDGTISYNGAEYGGLGGSLSWRNDIPVEPKEILTITVGKRTGRSSSVADRTTSIYRGSELLLTAIGPGGTNNPLLVARGGKDASPVNDGGGNGGAAPKRIDGGGGAGGSGAGGYMGNGGDGGNGNNDGKPGQGGGGGGGVPHPKAFNSGGYGGGVGLRGMGNNGAGGTTTSRHAGNGSTGNGGVVRGAGQGYTDTANGGVRIIWGNGRAYPATNTKNM